METFKKYEKVNFVYVRNHPDIRPCFDFTFKAKLVKGKYETIQTFYKDNGHKIKYKRTYRKEEDLKEFIEFVKNRFKDHQSREVWETADSITQQQAIELICNKSQQFLTKGSDEVCTGEFDFIKSDDYQSTVFQLQPNKDNESYYDLLFCSAINSKTHYRVLNVWEQIEILKTTENNE
jgi:hypothetical protein